MTGADLLAGALIGAQVAASVAILVTLVLRWPARRLIGAELTYKLWVIVPAAAAASLFPSLSQFASGHGGVAAPPPHAAWILEGWFAGALVLAGMMALGEAMFRRAAARGEAGPAVMGVAWPRIVTPTDYAERFTAAEQALIGRHERTHIARRDPDANLFIAAMRVVGWFNPLVHLAGACARLDQELACDAGVIEAWPACRRDYAATLIKAHLSRPRSPLACAWRGPHPLEVRLSMLSRRPLSLSGYLKGAAAVGFAAVAVALGVWGLAP